MVLRRSVDLRVGDYIRITYSGDVAHCVTSEIEIIGGLVMFETTVGLSREMRSYCPGDMVEICPR